MAQTAVRTIAGKVVDAETHKALPHVTCKVLDAQGKLLSYATTDIKGGYSVKATERAAKMTFSLIGYEEVGYDIADIGTQRDVSMKPTEFTIKEVTVTARPIEINEDTVKYNVAAFKSKEDKYIEDVLKKMPDIEVKENGTIRYKGKDINQFNIEGQNLLGSRYNQATQNLSADAVAQVQVVENDQPIRALKGMQESDQATLNIKLKEGYKARPFGEVQGGMGVGLGDRAIWDNKLTLINVNKKHQMLTNARMNNSGTNLSYNTTEHLNLFDLDNYVPLPKEFISTSSLFQPPVREKRYLRNKSVSAGFNHICRLGKYGNVRTNITYYGSSETQTDSTVHVYGGDYTFSLFETNNRKMRRHTAVPELKYELNAPKTYLTDQLSAMFSFFTDRNAMGSNAQHITETTDRHPFYVKNKLNMTLNTGQRTFCLNSIVRWFRRSEIMDIERDRTKTEHVELQSFFMRNTVSTGFYL